MPDPESDLPESPAAHAARGEALWAAGDALGAVAAYAKAVAGDPRDARSAMNLAHALAACGNHDGALQWMRHAHVLDPSDPVLQMNLGAIHHGRGELAEAASWYARAVERKPDYAEAWLNFGNAALYAGDAATAVERFERALALAPQLRAALSNLIYALSYTPNATPDDIRRRAQEWNTRFAPALPSPPPERRAPRAPLRIGYVSPDLGNHPIGHFMRGVLTHHDRSEFHVTVYSERAMEDALSRSLRDSADTWVKTVGLSDTAMAARIRDDRIDILVDLAGHTAGNRLAVFAAKPAPLQLTWMGSVGTTGLAAIDGLIADRFHVPPGDEGAYVETVMRLPDSFLCYTPPPYAPPVAEPPSLRRGCVTFGCFSNPAKINPPLLVAWAEILQRVPRSRLLLKYRWMDATVNRERIERALAAAGVELDRVTIEGESPHEELLRRYNDVDIALDTSPYSGGATTLEALWMGVPVVTEPNTRFAGRHSFSFLAVLGLERLIAVDRATYIERAVVMAVDRDGLSDLRRTLRSRMTGSPICDNARFTRYLEKLYRDFWNAGPPKAAINRFF